MNVGKSSLSDHAAETSWPTVVGTGLLADTLRASLSSRFPQGTRTVLLAADGWQRPNEDAVRAEHGLRWLGVHGELGRVVIGPTEQAGIPGCARCAENRRRMANEQAAGEKAVWHRHGEELAAVASAWLTPLAADTVARLVCAEVERLERGLGQELTKHAVLTVDLDTLSVSRHQFLPDPLCETCGSLPDDRPESAVINLSPRPKLSPESYRVRSLTGAYERLTALYCDGDRGIIRTVRTSSEGGVAVASAPLGLRGTTHTEFGFGRSASFQASKLTALLEALERYGGLLPSAKRTRVHASYLQVRDVAVDPYSFGLYPDDRYRSESLAFRQYDHDVPRYWVWAYSFGREMPVLVPQTYAYYRVAPMYPDDPPFVFESSNGCALGNCLEEAILHGLLELIERDAFLLTWYARLPVSRIALSSARDRSIPMIAEQITQQTGFDISVFDTTLEHGVPSVWALAVNPRDDGRAKAVCAAAAHPDAERAALAALFELGPITAANAARPEASREQAARMLANPANVTSMEDHALLYTHRDAFSRLEFLFDGEQREFTTPPGQDPIRRHDLRDDLLDLIGRMQANGLDVIVVNQTTPEHRIGGFSCVKVIVPGLLPMTFGHQNRRVDGIPRLYQVPKLLGKSPAPLTAEEVNPHPHPFP